MTDRIDTSMQPMEPPCGDPMIDRIRPESHPKELPPRNDPVLPLGERSNHLVECLQLTAYFADK
jgi:hypothetical protein